MAEFTLFPATADSQANTFTPATDIVVQKIHNPYNFSLNVVENENVIAGTNITVSSSINFEDYEVINGIPQTPKVVITYA
jgi:hypothetical protein